MTQRPPFRLAAGAAALALFLSVPPVVAQDGGTEANPDLAEGAEMVAEGFKKLFQGLMGELGPAGEAAEEGWSDFVGWLGDLSAYEAPERLPNGDILIRRKEPMAPGTDL
ncbi:MAG: AAA+ family ATPase [Maritimibacter sp.]|nr:AAA+ family ATPase [Maritimibacter sp.]